MSKKKLKPILGSEFYVCRKDAAQKDKENWSLPHLCVLAKSHKGWKNLMRASSASFRPEFFYRKPRLNLERLAKFAEGEFIVFSGHMGSDLADAVFKEPKLAYAARSVADAKSLAGEGWHLRVFEAMDKYCALFGRENFYVEIQLVDRENLPASVVVAEGLRWAARKRGLKCVATADSHYCRRGDSWDHRILLCTALDARMADVERRVEAGEDVSLGAFFRSSNYHIPSAEEMAGLHAGHPDELAHSLEIASRCESYDVGGRPLLPSFDCPGGLTPDEYLAELCKRGWGEKILGKIPAAKLPAYEERLWKKEFPVLTGAGLSSYFLIVWDVIRHAREDLGARVGKGRGSAAGCLVSYLTDITRVDPIRYDLLFERFYNAGRNAPGRVALPDIDSDFPIRARGKVIDYLRGKYGRDRVCQMATFSRMQGKSALQDVLRANGAADFETALRVTEHVPDESGIADLLQEMREETGEASIIRWALENHPGPLREWAELAEDGSVTGDYGKYFEQAIRLEGTKRNMGKHASGVIVCSEPLADVCPMVWDSSAEEMMVGVDHRDAESMGLVKLDILGLRTLDCIQGAENLVRTGRLA